jgi:hypothetical protein
MHAHIHALSGGGGRQKCESAACVDVRACLWLHARVKMHIVHTHKLNRICLPRILPRHAQIDSNWTARFAKTHVHTYTHAHEGATVYAPSPYLHHDLPEHLAVCSSLAQVEGHGAFEGATRAIHVYCHDLWALLRVC